MGKPLPRDAQFEGLLKLWKGPFPALTVLYARRYLTDFPDDALAWLFLGNRLVDLARYGEAEEALTNAIELCPPEKRRIPFIQMGHLFDERGDCDQAAGWYRKAIEFAPQDTDGYIY